MHRRLRKKLAPVLEPEHLGSVECRRSDIGARLSQSCSYFRLGICELLVGRLRHNTLHRTHITDQVQEYEVKRPVLAFAVGA